jgi:hypothetical protein
VSALTLSAVTVVLSEAKLLSAATAVESVPVASVEAEPPLQAVSAKEATKPSKKIDFFMVFLFLFCPIYSWPSSLCSTRFKK